MANVLGRITVNNIEKLEVDANPAAAAGTTAPVGSEATYNNAGVAELYLKIGAADTAWDKIATSSSGGVGIGNFLSLPLYNTDATGNTLDDQVLQNGFNVSVAVEPQPSRSTAIAYRFPNPGNAVTAADVVLTQGAQTIGGDKTFSGNAIFSANLTVNGTLTFVNSTNLEVTDKLFTLNKNGLAASGGSSGFEIEEGGSITGGFRTSVDRLGFVFDAPASANTFTIDLSGLTASRVLLAPDAAGTLVARPSGTPGVAGQITFWQDANLVTSDADLFFDVTNTRLGIGTNTPSTSLHVVGGARITALNAAGVVKNDANGNLSTGQVNLTTEVSGILPVANGGTNSSATLNNNRIIVSVGGALVEAAALTNGQLLIGSTGAAPAAGAITGTANQISVALGAGTIGLSLPQDIHAAATPTFAGLTLSAYTAGSVVFAGTAGLLSQDNANFFWDDTNNRLGLGTATPARTLDVNGSAVVRGPLRLAASASLNANYELIQNQVSTTDATLTNIATVALATDSMALIEAKIVGRRTSGSGSSGDCASFVRTALVKNVGGTATIVRLQTDFTGKDVNAWDGTIAATGTSAFVRVRGAASTNVDWTVTYSVQTLS
jgi:hypothetical protein